MIDIVIVAAIFGYAGFALYRGFKKSKKGACASCSQQKSCSAACGNYAASSSVSPAKGPKD
ncbi:MAG: FeoB-associated Cys-rich membrane protein [Paenibacillus sp.]|uniref:FeoB-associated Cys-rich membrane protein n=1 Tax=Paenibacillus sp. TaxID=58172 RepID=UPI0028FDDC8E|nr:FeoB-associated Cys-rich membrane protein [Paenibacillus sp.]MDU2242060.1 FeoB-associated Cys-rich membrane protein [Paenibacillus sp.]